MSAVDEAPAPTGRRCPRCGAGLTEQQEWCLHCGAAVGARVVAAPGWRAPIALAGALLALTAVALTLAIVTLADDADQVAQPPAAAVPATTPTPAPTPAETVAPTDPSATGEGTATPTPTPTPAATPEGTTTPAGVETWPDGESGWTIILASERSRDQAETKAEGFVGDGLSGVGILDTDDFSSLTPGYWAVYTGRYDSRGAAEDALAGVDAPDAYVRQVTPG
jgi:cell division septation protein DedD